MKKRTFLTTLAGMAVVPAAQAAPRRAAQGPTLLTLTGAIGRGNRGPLDPAFDQMMKKQGMKFERAHAFDFAALTALPAASIKPTLEYDGKPHTLSGPLLSEVLAAADAALHERTKLVLRAVDGYNVIVPLAEVRKYRYLVATHLDGKPIPLGGLGPLWAVYEADGFEEMRAKPLGERFALCPWGLYNVEVL